MDETLPDAAPLSQKFLASLASFMEQEHELQGEGDISSQVKCAIAEAKAHPGQAAAGSNNGSSDRANGQGTN